MKLNIEQIKEVTTGAVNVLYENGKYYFSRFNEQEKKVIDNPNVPAPAGIQMKFRTDGKLLKIKIHTEALTEIRSYFSFDIFVNGVLAGCIQNLSDDECKGDYANLAYSLGDFKKEIELPVGENYIKIAFPHSAIVQIEEIEIVGATYITPVRKDKTILFYGDSITQGYDALHPTNSYAARLAEVLDADVMNKALGGAIFDPELVRASEGIKPDYIVVSYGTNDWNSVNLDTLRKNAEGFMYALEEKFSGIPTFVITPLWRPDWRETKKCGEFFVIENTIKEFFEGRKNITVISGFDLIPHEEKIFGDLILHPNDKGFEYYTKSLLKYFK